MVANCILTNKSCTSCSFVASLMTNTFSRRVDSCCCCLSFSSDSRKPASSPEIQSQTSINKLWFLQILKNYHTVSSHSCLLGLSNSTYYTVVFIIWGLYYNNLIFKLGLCPFLWILKWPIRLWTSVLKMHSNQHDLVIRVYWSPSLVFLG